MARRRKHKGAARAHRRRLAKARRMRRGRKRSRRNPSRVGSRRYAGQGASIWAHSVAARKKAKAAKKRKRRKSRKGGTKAARKRAGKKAAATRARKKAARSRAAKRGARKRKGRKGRKGGRKMARRRKHRKVRRLKARARRKRYGRGVRSLVRARRSIKYSRKHGSGFARRYLKRYRMRSNPMGAAKDMIKSALPVVIGIAAARAVTVGLDHIPGVSGMLAKVPVVAPGVVRAAAGAAAVYALTRFVPPLKKYQNPAMLGAGVNLLLSAVAAYAPASIQGWIGAGEYQDVSGYVSDVGEYEEMGNYEEMGAMQDAAGWAEGLAKGVGRHSALRQLPSHSVVDEVPGFSEGDFQEGIFANTGWNN